MSRRKEARRWYAFAAALSFLTSVWGTVLGGGTQDLVSATGPHLFIDDLAVESMSGLTRVLHQPERHPHNPVISGTEPWEKWSISPNGLPVLYDEESEEFKMWYVAVLIEESAGYGELHRVCYAVSKDGVRWTKPHLGQVEWANSRRNNMIQWGQSWMRRPSVIKDPHDPDPTRRFKMIYSDLIEGRTAVVKAYSIDGIHWRLNGDGQPWFRTHHNSELMGWDPSIQKYVLYTRVRAAHLSGTSIGRSTSTDFVTWSEPEVVLEPEPEVDGIHLQGLAAFQYENLYLGLLRVRRREASPSVARDGSLIGQWPQAWVELAFSRDGIRWSRYSPGKPFFKEGEAGAWDDVMVAPMVAPVRRNGKLWFYYTGQNHAFGKEPLRRVQQGWEENGMRIQMAGGLATLRQDGFVSLDAGKEEGALITKPLRLPGGSLNVNADVRGELRVEILEENGTPFADFHIDNCRPIRSDSLNHVVQWNGRSTLDSLKGRVVRLRFQMREGRLYSFRFNATTPSPASID